jgi:hypothetical protein
MKAIIIFIFVIMFYFVNPVCDPGSSKLQVTRDININGNEENKRQIINVVLPNNQLIEIELRFRTFKYNDQVELFNDNGEILPFEIEKNSSFCLKSNVFLLILLFSVSF